MADRRRSPRLVWDVGIVVRGVLSDNSSFIEQTFTLSISDHGALLLLSTKVEIGQPLFFRNPLTGNEIPGRVVRFGNPHGGLSVVGIEFLEPSKEFWPTPGRGVYE